MQLKTDFPSDEQSDLPSKYPLAYTVPTLASRVQFCRRKLSCELMVAGTYSYHKVSGSRETRKQKDDTVAAVFYSPYLLVVVGAQWPPLQKVSEQNPSTRYVLRV